MIDAEKLTKWSKEIHETAVAHGWHEEKHSPEHYLALVMTEVAEAVEADRKGKRANISIFEKDSQTPQPINCKERHWYFCFEMFIKNSIEDEFADVIIRLLDMANELYGDNIRWKGYIAPRCKYNSNKSFIENAWAFVSERLGWGTVDITESIKFMYDWAEHLGIALDQHIEWKMKYNELRPYKHGGKKY